MDGLITIKQLPIIEEQLKSIEANIKSKVSGVLALECTENTVKAIKVLRADLNKDFAELEERRKLVKKKVMEPYEAFEAIYKERVTNIFKSTDDTLKKRIDYVENALKAEKRTEVESYFNEYRDSKQIDFVEFCNANINVTLSASKKSLKEAAKAFIDRICNDLELIGTQEHKEEILVEYKQSLNVSSSITMVCARHKAIEDERKKTAAQIIQTVKEPERIAVQNIAPILSSPEKTYKMTFSVRATKDKLRELKQYLINNNYEIL